MHNALKYYFFMKNFDFNEFEILCKKNEKTNLHKKI